MLSRAVRGVLCRRIELRYPVNRQLSTTSVLIARKRSNKGFPNQKRNDDDGDHIAKFETNRLAEKEADKKRQAKREKERSKKKDEARIENETIMNFAKGAYVIVYAIVGLLTYNLIDGFKNQATFNEVEKLDRLSKRDFFDRYLSKGKIYKIWRLFNSDSNDTNTEFVVETHKGRKFLVTCSADPFRRQLADIEADLRIRPDERFSTQGDFPLYAPLSISRPAKSREEFVDTMERNLLFDGFNLFILLPVALWLGAPTKANQQKLARMIAPQIKQAQQGSSQKASKAIKPVKVENITLADVAGMKGEKEEVQEFINFLRNPRRYKQIGAKMPKGLLLHGPPGTGKTLFGKAVAGECDVPFYYVNGSDFNKSYVGEGAKMVRDLFAKARTSQPCIIYIDEIDSVGQKRSGGTGGDFGSDKDSTLNQLLVEMDGLTTDQEIIVMGATNRSETLDPALKRPGRLTRDIMCGLPNREGREEILKVHLAKTKTKKPPSYYAPNLAELTVGMSGAQLANVANEAALAAARAKSDLIDQVHFDEAIDRVQTGLKKMDAVRHQDEKKTLAVIEGGKCLVSWLLKSQDPVLKTTITPRTHSKMGHTQFKTRERFLKSEEYLIDRIAVLTAGKIAQRILLGRILESRQGDKDLARAGDIATEMVKVYGMGKNTGQVNLSGMVQQTQYGNKELFSAETKKHIDMDRMIILQSGRQIAEQLIEDNKDKLLEIVSYLNKHEVITADILENMLGEKQTEEEYDPR